MKKNKVIGFGILLLTTIAAFIAVVVTTGQFWASLIAFVLAFTAAGLIIYAAILIGKDE
jgi:hydroxyethylthiazole kinase-like sugar kinase family protein